MSKKTYAILAIVVLFIIVAGAVYIFSPGMTVEDLNVVYPLDGTMFPPEIAAPRIWWEDSTPGVTSWDIVFSFQGETDPILASAEKNEYTPPRELWETIKKNTLGKPGTVTVTGYKSTLGFRKAVSRKSFSLSTSGDEVGAPIFFRAVTLPFEYAVNNMETIRWCLGDISSYDDVQTVLDNMPVCGNCHSFSADGKLIGMDVDYANDKGSFIISEVAEDIPLNNESVITWSDYRKEDGDLTFGLLSQLSPDGRYAISMVKDRSVFVPVDDLYYSQLFFPLKGILVYYDRETGRYTALNGASDKRYVQGNPIWSPDGKEIMFAKSEVGSIDNDTGQVLLTQAQCEKYISRRELFKFDLYRVPFNDGKGGEAVPIEGASNNDMSNYFPKYSPDGKWIVFCRAESFMLLQPDSRLYIMPAEGGEPREMTCNTDNMNSWHSWSPNGKWMVFTSKQFTPYTQLFLTHIDENGNDTPPVLLERFTPPDRAANIPEFLNADPGMVMRMHEQFIDYYSYFNKAGQMVDEGRLVEAEQFFRRSIELKPDFPNSHKRLGYLLTRLHRVSEAEKEWKTALELDPSDHLLHLNLGSMYLDRQEIDMAAREFESALRLDKNCAPAHAGLGIILINKGDIEGAKKRFRLSIETDPGFDEGYYRLGTIYSQEEDFEQAEQCFRKAFDLNPNNAGACLGLARILASNDDKMSDAVSVYNRAISLNPSDVQAYIELGNLYVKLGDRQNAINVFERALQINPNVRGVREFLAQLKRG